MMDLTNRTLMQDAEKRMDHARRCKKAPDECVVCQGNIAWFRELTPGRLSTILEEKQR